MELQNYIKKKYGKKVKISLRDMEGYFKGASQKDLKKNPEIYSVYIKEEKGDMNYGLTILRPGSIGRNKFMTRGHKHKNPLSEIYIFLEGAALLLMQKGAKKISVKMKNGKVYFIPGDLAHRVINNGNKNAVFISIYSKKAGHVYKKGLFK